MIVFRKATRDERHRISGGLIERGDNQQLLVAFQEHPPGAKRDARPRRIASLLQRDDRGVGFVGEGRVVWQRADFRQPRPAYDARVRAVAGLARSAWTSITSASGAADTTAPGAPTGMSVLGIQRGYSIRWTNPGDSDLDRVELWQADYVGDTYHKVAETKASVATVNGFSPGDVRYFAVKAIDRSGNASALVYAGTATVPRLVTDDLVASSITGAATVAINNTVSVTPPGSGGTYNFAEIGSVTVTLEGDGRALVYCRFPWVYWETASETGGGGTGGGGGGE
ncbi:MAG: hypothetical protein ACOYOH_27545 [Paracraurococcus sp.]